MLVIPDFYDRAYVQSMVRTLLMVMGFKQLCVQQVTDFSLCRVHSSNTICRNH